MNELILKIITVLHALLVLFVIAIPFTGYTPLLLLHVVVVPFIIAHWLCNNNTCILTVIEKNLRKKLYGETEESCITCKLIEPVYDFKNNYAKFTAIIYILTIFLWLISSIRLFNKYRSNPLISIQDLFDA
jgi:hypothetical protein